MSDTERNNFRRAVTVQFAYLFDPPQFGYIREFYERGGEYQMQIAESALCLMKFRLEQDVFELSFARRDAPRTWDAEDGGKLWWHDFLTLAAFEDELRPELAAKLDPPSTDVSLAGQMRAYATLLRAYLPRITAAFGQDDPDDWWPEYRDFRTRRYRTSLPIA